MITLVEESWEFETMKKSQIETVLDQWDTRFLWTQPTLAIREPILRLQIQMYILHHISPS